MQGAVKARRLLLLSVCMHMLARARVCVSVCGGGRGSYMRGFTGVLIFELSLEGVSQMAKDHRSHSYSLYNSLYIVSLKDPW